MEHITDKEGKWTLRKGKKYQLIEPSQEYIIANTLSQEQLNEQHNQQITNEINSSNNELLEIFEDIVDWAEEKGFILSKKKKELINSRKEKRKGII